MSNKTFRKGYTIIISTQAYAKLNNIMLDNIYSKKARYDKLMVMKDISNGKKTRPIVIIWENKDCDRFIAAPMTTSNSKYNQKNAFYNKKNLKKITYWKFDPLVLKKNSTPINGYFEKWDDELIKEFLDDWKNRNNMKKSYQYLKGKINELKVETYEKMLKIEKK